MKRCQHCATILWPVHGLGRVCPKCDHLCCWPTINRGAQCPRHPWTVEARALPATQLQDDVNRIIANTPYDWEQEGDTL